MKKYSTFSLCYLTKLTSLSVLSDDCVAFLVPCLGPYCWKHTLPMWSAYPVCLPQQSCCQDMKKYSTFSLCHLTKLSFLSVLCDDCEAFLVPCLGIDCWKHTLPKWSVYPLFSITKLLPRHEEIFHVFSLSSDEVDYSIGFFRWLRSFSCSLPIGPYCCNTLCLCGQHIHSVCHNKAAVKTWRNIPRFLSVIWRSWVFYQFCLMIVKLFLFIA